MPSSMRSPSFRMCSVTWTPFTKVPLVLSRSAMTKASDAASDLSVPAGNLRVRYNNVAVGPAANSGFAFAEFVVPAFRTLVPADVHSVGRIPKLLCLPFIMKAGIIGLQSVGKTTIFNVLTHGKAAAGPAAGRRLEPNVGIVKVPDARLDLLSSKFNPEKTTHATVEFVDVQGLVRGKGQDMALAPVRTVDALLHVVRAFQDDAVPHSEGSVDPERDQTESGLRADARRYRFDRKENGAARERSQKIEETRRSKRS